MNLDSGTQWYDVLFRRIFDGLTTPDSGSFLDSVTDRNTFVTRHSLGSLNGKEFAIVTAPWILSTSFCHGGSNSREHGRSI